MSISELLHENIEINGQQVELIVRRNSRAKNIGIRVDHSMRVILTVPRASLKNEALKFLDKNHKWLSKVLKEYQSESEVTANNIREGMIVSVMGRPYGVVRFKTMRTYYKFDEATRTLYLRKDDNEKESLKRFYVSLAKKCFEQKCIFYADLLGLRFEKIAVRDQSSRWGSCSAKKTLSFSWRVILAPEEVVNYLVLHEICHLKHMNHSKRYWDLVNSVMTNHKKYDKWLKDNGLKLKGFLL